MIRWLKEMLLVNILLVLPMSFLPLACARLAFRPKPGAAVPLVFFAPLSSGFWTLIYSQFSSARVWQRAGRLHEWRRDHGGIFRTLQRACGWLAFGIMGSFLAEIAFCALFRGSPRMWFTLFPLASYSPLFACWLWRRKHP